MYTVVSITLSIISLIFFWVCSRFFDEKSIFYIGMPFALSIFLFSLVVLRSDGKEKSFKIAHTYIPKILLVALTMSSVLAVLFIPAYDGSILEWANIPLINWLRYLSSVFLTLFLPGYFLLKIMDRKGSINGSIVIVLSYLLSLFVTFLAGFFILLSGNTIGSFGSPIVIAINLAFVILYHFTSHKKTEGYMLTIKWQDVGLILSILAVITMGSTIIMINSLPLTTGDMTRHHGLALQYSNEFPVYGQKLITYRGGYLFHVYLAVLFALSGIPSALALQGLFLWSFMPILAFCCFIKAWFNGDDDEKHALIAIMLSILLGFGGLYALYLKFTDPAYGITQLLGITTSKTYDIYMRVLYLPDIVAPLWNVGLPTFFGLLFFVKKGVSNIIEATSISVLVALGYLGHTSEIIFFVLILFIYTSFIKGNDGKRICAYVVLGLLTVALLDLAAPAQMYIFSSLGEEEFFPSIFLVSLFLSTLTAVIELAKDRGLICRSVEVKKSLLKMLETSLRYGRWILVYAYFFSLTVWLTIQKDFNLWQWGGYRFTPFFVFPIRLGAVGLLTTIVIFIYFTEITRDRRLLFFLLLIPTGFILEQIANYYPLYYFAYRYATIAFIGACVIAAYGIARGLHKVADLTSISTRRKIIVAVFLGAIMMSGLLSTTLFYINSSYYSGNREISQDELDALYYVRQHTQKNSSVLTFTEDSANILRNFAGLNPAQDAQRWSKLLLSTSNPYIMTYILGSSNVKYTYVAQRDIELLESNKVLNSFVEHFPKVFENCYVAVYEVTSLVPPSAEASFGILHLLPSPQKLEDTTWVDDLFVEGWYPYRKYGNVESYKSEVKNGIMEISVTSNQSGTVGISYSLVLGLEAKDFVLSFRYKVDNDYTWFTINLRNASDQVFFHKGNFTDKVFSTKSYPVIDGQSISRIEIIVQTTDEAASGTSAGAQIDYVEILPITFSEENVLPTLFASLLSSKYSILCVDDVIMQDLDAYILNYSHILLTSDPPIAANGLLNWVSAGNTLAVLNTSGNGFFANLIDSEKEPSHLSIVKFNQGKIVYINSFSAAQVEEDSDLLQPDFLEKVKEALVLEEYKHRISILPVYNSTLGNIEINGDLNIYTDILVLQGSIDSTSSPFPLDESTEIKIYGKVNLTIKNTSLLIFPSEQYMIIKPKSYTAEGEVLVDGSETLIVADTNVTYNFNMPFSFEFRATGLSLYARLPSINASGTITFDQLDVHVAPYIPLAGIVQQKSEIQGSVRFDTMYVTTPFTIFSMFQAGGKILNLAETSTPPIPWTEILSSPYNVAFNIIFLLGIVLYVAKKRKGKITVNEEMRLQDVKLTYTVGVDGGRGWKENVKTCS